MKLRSLLAVVLANTISVHLPAQIDDDPTLHYTLVNSVVHESALEECLVSGSIEEVNRDNNFIPRIVILSSDSHVYIDTIDARNNFDFGFIKPGKYHVRLVNSFSVDIVQPFQLTPDSTKFSRGSFYDIQLLAGMHRNDTCCRPGYTFVLPIYFDLDSDTLRSESKVVLQEFYKTMQQHNLKVSISVHTDSRISREYSTCVTCKQANAIKSYLVALGANPQHIDAHGYQGSTPYFINAKTEEQHQMNRRVEVTVL